jgi:hypothetical protein
MPEIPDGDFSRKYLYSLSCTTIRDYANLDLKNSRGSRVLEDGERSRVAQIISAAGAEAPNQGRRVPAAFQKKYDNFGVEYFNGVHTQSATNLLSASRTAGPFCLPKDITLFTKNALARERSAVRTIQLGGLVETAAAEFLLTELNWKTTGSALNALTVLLESIAADWQGAPLSRQDILILWSACRPLLQSKGKGKGAYTPRQQPFGKGAQFTNTPTGVQTGGAGMNTDSGNHGASSSSRANPSNGGKSKNNKGLGKQPKVWLPLGICFDEAKRGSCRCTAEQKGNKMHKGDENYPTDEVLKAFEDAGVTPP